MRYVVVAALAALVASAAPVAAQSTGSANGEVAKSLNPGRILGIFDAETSNPIEGAEVIDRIANASAVTGKSGLVGLGSFKSQHDSSVVTVRKIGYQDTTFLVMQSDTTPITLNLEQAAPVLPAMLTEAMKDKTFVPSVVREFEQRRNDKAIHGVFITPEEMRASEGHQLVNVFLAKGVRDDSRGCYQGAIVYVDGMLQKQRGIPRGVDTTPYEAAEYYTAAQVPEQFNMTSVSPNHLVTASGGCGTVLLWTRVR